MSEILTHIPDVPVKETWEWATDVLVSNDGTEQRIAARGSVPRVTQKARYVFTDRNTLAAFSNSLLTALNEMWMPEWQFVTRLTQQTAGGATRLYFDHSLTDIRDEEYLIVGSSIYQVTIIHSDGATVTPALVAIAPVGSRVAPAGLAIIEDGSPLSRLSVNTVGESSLNGTYNRPRTALTRPGNASTLTLWSGVPVLNVRPLGDKNVEENVITEQIVIDNNVGAITLIDRWDYPRANISCQFMVNRTPIVSCASETVKDMDYWRHFFSYVRGAQRKFWLPTYRNDLTWYSGTGTSLTVEEGSYATNIFPIMPTHKYLKITNTSGGIHYCTVTAAVLSSGRSALTITPSRPAGTVSEISYLLPVRLNTDRVEWEHYGLHSLLNFSVRTAE